MAFCVPPTSRLCSCSIKEDNFVGHCEHHVPFWVSAVITSAHLWLLGVLLLKKLLSLYNFFVYIRQLHLSLQPVCWGNPRRNAAAFVKTVDTGRDKGAENRNDIVASCIRWDWNVQDPPTGSCVWECIKAALKISAPSRQTVRSTKVTS